MNQFEWSPALGGEDSNGVGDGDKMAYTLAYKEILQGLITITCHGWMYIINSLFLNRTKKQKEERKKGGLEERTECTESWREEDRQRGRKGERGMLQRSIYSMIPFIHRCAYIPVCMCEYLYKEVSERMLTKNVHPGMPTTLGV